MLPVVLRPRSPHHDAGSRRRTPETGSCAAPTADGRQPRLAERPHVHGRWPRRNLVIERQKRQHQFAEGIGFLQMRIVREDEGIDPNARYSSIRSAIVAASPTRAVPAPPR